MANQATPYDLNSPRSPNVGSKNGTAPDGVYLDAYMLEEARTLYEDRYPPFVSQRNRRRNYQGNRKVVVLANSNGRRPNANSAKKAELVCHAWDNSHVYWTLDLNGINFIVGVKGASFIHKGGAAYMIWRGFDKGFDEKITAFSPKESRDEKESHVDDETELPDEDSLPEESDLDYKARTNHQSNRKKQHSRAAKDKGNANIKHLATVTAETDRELKETRERQQTQALPKHKPRAQARPNTNNAARPSRPGLPTPWTGTPPSSPSGDSPPSRITVKRQRDSSRSPSTSPSEPLLRNTRQRVRSPSVIEISHTPNPSVDRYKQSHTTLHISLSTNNYGAVPIYLRSCMTVDAFFTAALSAWGLEGKEDEVAAVAVRFDWLKEDGPMVVRKGVVDSFQKMLETIAEAPVWGAGGGDSEGRRRCDVRVRIVRLEPAAT